VRVQKLVRRFGDDVALAGVDLIVHPREIHALLGPNGAGKTTLTRILCGLVDPDGGTVETSGRVGFIPSGDRTFYLRISGLENLVFFARLYGLRLGAAKRRARELLETVGLSTASKLPVGRYSHGMQKRLSVARALLIEPSVLLVDEATHDLDPEGARRVRALVAELADRGTAVLWTTQRIEEIRHFAHAVTLIHRGEVRFSGSVSELIERAPESRYVMKVRNGNPDEPPDARTLQLALGNAARVSALPGSVGEFLLAPAADRGLGSTMATLVEAGFEVTGCRQDHAEIEAAFLALAADGGP
jgi:ABC-2 type transport system ATP-binding protein